MVTGAVLATGTGEHPSAEKVRALVRVGAVRTLEQDLAYGLRMLVDIAIRGLSPAVNDPTSAIQSLDQIDDILDQAGRPLAGSGSLQVTRRMRALLDDLRAVAPAPRWPAIDRKLAALQRAFPDMAEEAEAARPDHQGIGSPRR